MLRRWSNSATLSSVFISKTMISGRDVERVQSG